MHRQNPSRSAVATICAAVLTAATGVYAASAHAEASPSTIYRCPQAGGGMGYQDFPCNGGVVVDVRPGVPNQDEIARLTRAQEAFERRAAARRADETALRREELMLRQQELEASRGAQSPQDEVYYPTHGFGGYLDGSRRPIHARLHDRGPQRHMASTGRVPAVIQLPRGR